jgi:hypothetical protein
MVHTVFCTSKERAEVTFEQTKDTLVAICSLIPLKVDIRDDDDFEVKSQPAIQAIPQLVERFPT